MINLRTLRRELRLPRRNKRATGPAGMVALVTSNLGPSALATLDRGILDQR